MGNVWKERLREKAGRACSWLMAQACDDIPQALLYQHNVGSTSADRTGTKKKTERKKRTEGKPFVKSTQGRAMCGKHAVSFSDIAH